MERPYFFAAVVGSGIMGERLAGGSVAIALIANAIATGSTLETSLTTSAKSRDTLPVQAAGAGSHQLRVGGGGRVSGGSSVFGCPPLNARNSLPHNNGVAHQTSLRSQRDHDDSCGLPSRREAGRLFILPVTITRTTSPHRHPRYRLTAPALVTMRDGRTRRSRSDRVREPTDECRACAPRRPRFAKSFLLQFSAIEATEGGVTLHGMDRRLAPEKPQQRIPLFREFCRVVAGRRSSIR